MTDRRIAARFKRNHTHLLESLYDSVTDQSAWPRFLAQLVDVTESRSARFLMLNEAADRVLFSTKFNIDDGAHQRYVEHFVNTCPWRPELKKKPGGRLYSTYLHFSCKQAEFYGTEFFNDWAREIDIHHGICGTVLQAHGRTAQLLVQRAGGQGHFSEHVTALVNSLLPHLRQVLRLQREVGDSIERIALRATELDGAPLLLVAADGRVLYLAPRAESLLAGAELRVARDRLQARDPALQARCDRLLAQTLQALQPEPLPTALAARDPELEIRRAGRAPLRVRFAPIPTSSLWEGPVCAALHLHDAGPRAAPDLAALQRQFGLTEAEARTAIACARGLAPQAIAARDGRSVHTVRTQLKAAFRKTGVHRQTELMKLLLGE